MNFEVGETVTLKESMRAPRLVRVVRITPTGRFVVAVGATTMTFNPDGTGRNNSAWSFSRISKTTQADLDEIELLKLRIAINKIKWYEKSLEELRAVLDVLGVGDEV